MLGVTALHAFAVRVVAAVPWRVVSWPTPLTVGVAASAGCGTTLPSLKLTNTVTVWAPPEVCEANMSNSSVGRRGFGFLLKSQKRAGDSTAVPILLGDKSGNGVGNQLLACGRMFSRLADRPKSECRNGS